MREGKRRKLLVVFLSNYTKRTHQRRLRGQKHETGAPHGGFKSPDFDPVNQFMGYKIISTTNQCKWLLIMKPVYLCDHVLHPMLRFHMAFNSTNGVEGSIANVTHMLLLYLQVDSLDMEGE